MTIKRRLFFSNILMIVIPLLFSLLMIWSVLSVLAMTTHFRDGRIARENRGFFLAKKQMRQIAEQSTEKIDITQIKKDVEEFNMRREQRGGKGPAFLVYKKGILITPAVVSEDNPALQTVLSRSDPMMLIQHNTAVCSEIFGDYKIVFLDPNFPINDFSGYGDILFACGVGTFISVIFVIFLTNRILTHYVSQKIIFALDTLTYGVHQIRDGNLDYRIQYPEKDEFTDACADFNEMAERLAEAISAKHKDELNRKELIVGLSHDLRTPLTSIKAYIEGLESGLAATPQIRTRYIETIRNKTRDLEQIIDTLLLLSKLNLGEYPWRMERVNLTNGLSKFVAELRDEYEFRGLTLSLNCDADDLHVKVDVAQLRSALINVLENSIKYGNRERGEMRIDLSKDGEHAAVVLTDNGPGVAEEALPKLFEIFYRCDPSRCNPGRGSGLGLSITAKTVEGFGGTIEARNVPEGGLCIVMRLPLHTGEKSS